MSVVVMAYNEEAALEAIVREIHETLARCGHRFELLIVNDGSSDDTGTVADRLAAALPGTRVAHHQANRGLGGVYRTGFDEAREDLLTFFPADGQFPATILDQFLPLMGDADIALGYLEKRPDSTLGRVLSWAERRLYRVLFGPMPRFQGIFMVRRALLDHITLSSRGRGWAVVMELILRAQRAGYRLRSEPTPLRARHSGRSKVRNPRTTLANLRQVLVLAGTLRRSQ